MKNVFPMLMLTMTLTLQSAFAQSTYINPVEAKDVAEARRLALLDLQQDMAAKFENVEGMLARGETKAALGAAKQILDTVRIKTGIDPKARIQESFLVPITFPEGKTEFSELEDQQKEIVIRTIAQFRGGLYMDLMNLSKRTTLLYIKAFADQLSKMGGLTGQDRAKIVDDLLKATLVPMPVQDKAGTKIIVLDEDVANEDHTYFFNREIEMYLLENKSLGITRENFDQRKSSIRWQLLNGINGQRPNLRSLAYEMASTCIEAALKMEYSSDQNNAAYGCFGKFANNVESFNECNALAGRMIYTSVESSAKKFCFSKFQGDFAPKETTTITITSPTPATTTTTTTTTVGKKTKTTKETTKGNVTTTTRITE